MSIKLLPASVNSVFPSQATDLSTGLAPLTQRALATPTGQNGVVPSVDTFSWSSSTRPGRANWIDGTPVEGSQSDETVSAGEYVSGGAWSHSLESTAVANYLLYAGNPSSWRGQLINVYA
ncbi:MAG: hypothetical protein WBS24_15470 [Terriglobales bacterium]